jgi:hypothetical protein
MNLWNNETELQFFKNALEKNTSPEKLFYNLNSGYYAYIPKSCDSEGQTLQSRNTLIGQFTEKWAKDIFEYIAQKFGLYAVNNVECEEIGLTKKSEADLAFCTTNSSKQKSSNIKLIFEIKMSIVSNYKYSPSDKTIEFIGDYKTHKGMPSLLRSDSVLKAIGKAINIRVSGNKSNNIPIIILGNSPITNNYKHKVDFLKAAGVIQGFWSLNPVPTDSDYIEKTENNGFQTIKNLIMLQNRIDKLLNNELNYFSSMISKSKLGECIRISSQENSDEAKAEKFLSLIREL